MRRAIRETPAPRAAGRSAAPPRRCSARRRRAGRRPESRARRPIIRGSRVEGRGSRGEGEDREKITNREHRQHRGFPAGRPAAAAADRCSTTSTAAPTAKSRCARTCAPSRTSASGRDRRSTRRRRISAPPFSARRSSLPFILAPVGSSRMFWPRGEEVAAKVAGDAGTIYSPVDAVGMPARGREEVDARHRRGTSCICAADATSPARRSSARRTRATRR